MATTTAYCLCGSSCRITTNDASLAAGAIALWWQVHTGPGHGPATPAQARAAQRASAQYGFECGIQTPSQDSHHG